MSLCKLVGIISSVLQAIGQPRVAFRLLNGIARRTLTRFSSAAESALPCWVRSPVLGPPLPVSLRSLSS